MVPGVPATTLPTSTVSGWQQWRRSSSLGRNLYQKHWKLGSSTHESAAARCVWKACRVAPAILPLAVPSSTEQSPHKPKPSEEERPKPIFLSEKLYSGVSFGLDYWILVILTLRPNGWAHPAEICCPISVNLALLFDLDICVTSERPAGLLVS